MEMEENPGLKANVMSMYKSRFQREAFLRPKIVKDYIISGKLKKEHVLDIYFEFIQMNNLERTIIKIVEGTELRERDVWEFANVLKDMHFYAKGIIYYDDKVSIDAQKSAEQAGIELEKFVFFNEIKMEVLETLKIMLPEKGIVGDLFWVVMEMENENGNNTGNYNMINNKILLFLSKKQADNYCMKLKGGHKVFGISQNHLKVLVGLQEKSMFPEFCIALPQFEQKNDGQIICYSISHEKFRKFYLRGNKK